MRTVTKREFNQRTGAVLGRVTATDDVVVTERGKADALLNEIRGDH